MAEILIVPGRGNSGPGHWQTWLEGELAASRRIEQDDWDAPWLLDWMVRLRDGIDAAPGPALLVAHSFGCLAAVAAGLARPERVAGALLVAPADPWRFGIPDVLLEEPLPFPSILVASENDPWMSLAGARRWAGLWGSRLVSLGEAGHINGDSGYGPWPQALALLDELDRQAATPTAADHRAGAA